MFECKMGSMHAYTGTLSHTHTFQTYERAIFVIALDQCCKPLIVSYNSVI